MNHADDLAISESFSSPRTDNCPKQKCITLLCVHRAYCWLFFRGFPIGVVVVRHEERDPPIVNPKLFLSRGWRGLSCLIQEPIIRVESVIPQEFECIPVKLIPRIL